MLWLTPFVGLVWLLLVWWLVLVVGDVVWAQVVVRSFVLVAAQVDVTKHLLSATLAPMSAQNCLERFMPCTVVEACRSLLAYMNKSSASTLGSTLCALMYESHGFMSRAIRAIENGHPCGIEHRCC